MDLRIGTAVVDGFFFRVFNVAGLLVMLPLFEMVVLPLVQHIRGGKGLTVFERLVLGQAAAICSVLAAAALEYPRRLAPDTWVQSPCASDGVTMSALFRLVDVHSLFTPWHQGCTDPPNNVPLCLRPSTSLLKSLHAGFSLDVPRICCTHAYTGSADIHDARPG